MQKYRVVDDEGNIDTVALFAMLAYGQQEAEKARQEELERLEKEIKYYRSTLESIADMAHNCPDTNTVEECKNLLAHIHLDACWTLRETDKEEQK